MEVTICHRFCFLCLLGKHALRAYHRQVSFISIKTARLAKLVTFQRRSDHFPMLHQALRLAGISSGDIIFFLRDTYKTDFERAVLSSGGDHDVFHVGIFCNGDYLLFINS
ncbi:hypothetical protein AB6A40_004469 [Gnathostoma spinigerum]|uniref:Uncharacterized protein n=1 Tax=Gnathostoma spinigerum TaxID=75299 RepID=A0ABD6EN96_9BILA